ncbi:MAG: Sec-independent protein translocase protein TatB [Burkholderiaceae bacterium]|jgi:sec-independent protein translocase protein TatB
MFGIDVEKLAIIGTVALIVLGPERLPRLARTLGALLGRAQRYMADVKAEVAREIQLDELKNVRDTVRDAARNVESSVYGKFAQTQSDITQAIGNLSGGASPTTSAEPAAETRPAPLPASRKKLEKWRRNMAQRQGATPLWYRLEHRQRTRLLSGAARVARYRTRPSR